jgi:HAD superfamily hydrolase (TIGR01509 family)
MSKAFIFDFDGVIINNESLWERAKEEIFLEFFGKEIFLELGSTIGLNRNTIYEKAVELGSNIQKKELFNAFDARAAKIYQIAEITPSLDELCKKLVELNYKIGIVSASPIERINLVLDRLFFKKDFNYVLSLESRLDLRHKPAPDGYIEAIKQLNSIPQSTIVLEDSNIGISSGKAAGAYVIGLRQNLAEGYVQEGADKYANTMHDILPIVEKFAANEF